MSMTAILIFLAIALGIVVGVGGLLILVGLRRAPSAIEDETGFHAIKGSVPAPEKPVTTAATEGRSKISA